LGGGTSLWNGRLKKSGFKPSAIAAELGKHVRTIQRELKRNFGKNGYRYQQAHNFAVSRRSQASQKPWKATTENRALVTEKIQQEWSPEQISGWLDKQKKGSLSRSWIYQFLHADKRAGGTLWKSLRHGGKPYNKRPLSSAGRGCIPGRVDISERPAIVEEKARVGDWELDTIIGAGHKGVLVTMIDRASKMVLVGLAKNKSAKAVTTVLKRMLRPYKEHVLTLTADNGKEFAYHKKVSKALGADFYFAKPYASWQRGLNEHTNGLIRQYFPKGTRLDTLTSRQVKEVQNKLNERPRKSLDYKTPKEYFYAAIL
jgi:IS30 family transposase